jgi:pimeloyl-ACP methyl ester carboxylesterase
MHRVEVAGGEIEYQWVGVRDGWLGTLVFLHEGLGCAGMWGRYPHALATSLNVRALVYSRFGYGGSSPLRGPRSSRFLDDEARVLPQLLDALGVRMPVLVGQSDGASIALIHAAASPWSVAGLILEAPHVFTEQATLDGIHLVHARYADDPDFRGKFGRYHRDPNAVVDEWARAWLAPGFRDWSVEPALGSIVCPVLLLQAEHDPYGTLVHVDRIAAAVHGPVRKVVLPGDGHAPHRDCRTRTFHEMSEFLASLAMSA